MTTQRKVISSNPAIDTAIYSSGDQLGPVSTKLSEVFRGPGDIAALRSIVIVDAVNQKAAIDILFWMSKPTVTSTDNATFALTAANLKTYFCGFVSIAAGDYVSIGSVEAIASKIVSPVQPLISLADTNNPRGRDLYYTMVSRGTPTYTAATDLVLSFRFEY